MRVPTGTITTTVYATRVENLFLQPYALALEEYGIPVQIATRLAGVLGPADSLDDVPDRVKAFDVGAARLTAFKRHVVLDAQGGL